MENKELVDAVDRATFAVQGLLNFVLYNVIGAIATGIGIAISLLWHAGDTCNFLYTSCTANHGPQIFGGFIIGISALFTVIMSVVSVSDALKKSSKKSLVEK